jgi:hypothetical protein
MSPLLNDFPVSARINAQWLTNNVVAASSREAISARNLSAL